MRRPIVICVLLALGTLAIYWHVSQFAFFDYYDQDYVTQNAYVARGLSWDGIRHAFTDRVLDYWQPVTLMTHMVDCHLFGVTPAAPHRINLALHIADTLLLFLLLRRMTRQDWHSAVVAALFAFHPLHVESVAWIAERKDVLSTFFWCLTLWCYLNYVERRHWRHYAMALLFFGLGLLSKSMLVTLPCLLLLLDYWPLNRIAWPSATDLPRTPAALARAWRNADSPLRGWCRTWGRLIAEKTPFFLLALGVSALTFHWQSTRGSFISSDVLPLHLRIANAFVSYSRYLGKTFWPTDLVVFYPHPGVWPAVRVAGAILLFAGLSWFALSQVRRRPYLTVGWLWFVGLLLPTIGLVQAGWQSLADHYTYVPLTGLFIILVWGAEELSRRFRTPRLLLPAVAAAALIACAVTARAQCEHWRSSYDLFSHAVESSRDNAIAEMGLGNALLERGESAEALQHMRNAIRIYPRFTGAYNHLAAALAVTGHPDEAETNYATALTITPRSVDAHRGLANILLDRGDTANAIVHYRAVLDVNPELPDIHFSLGNALARQGHNEEARQQYEQALHIAPDLEEAHHNLALMALNQGREAEAIGHLNTAIRLRPDLFEPLFVLARVRATSRDASVRNGEEAVRLAEEANRLSGRSNVVVLDTLAAAYAEAGKFPAAISAAQEAARLARSAGQAGFASAIDERVKLYQAGKPYREVGGR